MSDETSMFGRIWSLLTFSFIGPYLVPKYGFRIKQISGLPELFESDRLDLWVERFSRAFEEEERNSFYRRNRGFCIYRPLFWILWKPILNALLLRLCFDILALVSSVLLSFFSMSSTKEKTFLSSLCIFVLVVSKSFFDSHSRFITSRVCLRIEGSLIWIALDRIVRHKNTYPELPGEYSVSCPDGKNDEASGVYNRERGAVEGRQGIEEVAGRGRGNDHGETNKTRELRSNIASSESASVSRSRKSMLLRQHEAKFTSSNAANESSNIFNLIIGDASTIEIFFGVFVDFLLLPLRLFMSWYVLSNVLGNTSALPAIFTFCIVLILSFLLEIVGALYKEPFMVNRDKRIDRCHEVLTEMRSIRLSGLEDVVISRVNESREKELHWNRKRFIYSRIAAFTDYHLKVYSQYVLFILSFYYSFKGATVNNDLVHTGASALQILVLLSSKIRGLPTSIIEGLISLHRYENFIKRYPIDKFSSHSYSTNNERRQVDGSDSYCDKPNSRFGSISQNQISSYSVLDTETSRSLLDKIKGEDVYTNASFHDNYLVSGDYQNREVIIVLIKGGFFTWANNLGRKRIGKIIIPKSSDESQTESPPSSKLENINPKDSLPLLMSSEKDSKNGEESNYRFPDLKQSSFSSSFSQTSSSLSSSLPYGSNNINNSIKNNPDNVYTANQSNNTLVNNSFSPIPLALFNIDLKLTMRECIFLIGEPGCGKSSLIKAILGEIRCVSAQVNLLPFNNGTLISYSPQLPWIPGGSVRSVILFGREWNREKYELIVDCCQLKEDFLTWQSGDLRTVDEGGSSLSGGQRARISLARALYSLPSVCSCVDGRTHLDIRNISTFESYLYLLDDVFVSVDLEVGFRIFSRLFGPDGLLLGVASIVAISSDSLRHYMSGIKHLRSMCRNDKKICHEFDSFKFNLLVLNYGKVEWFGNYFDYEKGINANSSNSNSSFASASECNIADGIDNNSANGSVYGKRENNESGDFGSNFDSNINNNSMSSNWDGVDIGRKSPTSPIIVVPSFNTQDRLNNTDAQFEQLLSVSDSQIESEDAALLSNKNRSIFSFNSFSLNSYKWYFSLLGTKWVATFVLGCFAKISIDKVLELLFVSKPSEFQRSSSQINGFCIYATLAILTESLISLFIFLGEASGGIGAAKKSHEILLYKIVYAPFWFFDVNSVGKILSRFSSDMLALDNCIVRRMTAVFLPFIALLFNFSYVSYRVPLAIPLEFLIVYLIIKGIGSKLILTYRDAQRCALLVQSPLCSIFSECLSGGAIIRAFGAESFYFKKCGNFVDKLERSRLLQHAACQWACIRMQLISAPLTLLVSSIGILFIDYKSSLVLPLIYTISFAESINDIIFRLISLEKDMCSVARIHEYVKQLNDFGISQPHVVLGDSAIPDTRIGIRISNLEVRYRRPNYRISPSLLNDAEMSQKTIDEMYFSPTLRNINQFAAPNDHIGIIGRSGSGKSTFIMALFGFVPTTHGQVFLDGIPINQLSNLTRRKVVGVLPQVPLILKGWTVRDFLDPERKHSSEDLWEALRICCLSNTIRSLPGGKMIDTVLVPDITISSNSSNNKSSRGWLRRIKKPRSSFINSRSDQLKCHSLVNNEVGAIEEEEANRDHGNLTGVDHENSCSGGRNNEANIDSLVARYMSDSQLRYLSLARLVVNARDYRLILVDEPPPDAFDEHIHGRTYVPVHELLRTYFPHCTVFVVAHHAASLQNCNSIWVLRSGTIDTVVKPKGVVSQEYLAELLKSSD